MRLEERLAEVESGQASRRSGPDRLTRRHLESTVARARARGAVLDVILDTGSMMGDLTTRVAEALVQT